MLFLSDPFPNVTFESGKFEESFLNNLSEGSHLAFRIKFLEQQSSRKQLWKTNFQLLKDFSTKKLILDNFLSTLVKSFLRRLNWGLILILTETMDFFVFRRRPDSA